MHNGTKISVPEPVNHISVRTGLFRDRTPSVLHDDVVRLPLTRGEFALVSACDADELSKHLWMVRINRSGIKYAARAARNKIIVFMHRAILCPPPGYVVDHIDGNGLNNRRSNIRVCTPRQNNWNRRAPPGSTGFFGVTASRGRYLAALYQEGKRIHIGSFDTAESAARAYDAEVIRLRGEFASPNFPKEALL